MMKRFYYLAFILLLGLTACENKDPETAAKASVDYTGPAVVTYMGTTYPSFEYTITVEIADTTAAETTAVLRLYNFQPIAAMPSLDVNLPNVKVMKAAPGRFMLEGRNLKPTLGEKSLPQEYVTVPTLDATIKAKQLEAQVAFTLDLGLVKAEPTIEFKGEAK